MNFTDIEYSNRVNPIQRKYIPDLAAASETEATLFSSLNKGGGEKKGGSEAFFQNSAENFLAAIIYFFVNYHPSGYKNGKKLNRYVLYDGRKLKLVIRKWRDYNFPPRFLKSAISALNDCLEFILFLFLNNKITATFSQMQYFRYFCHNKIL